MDNILDIFSNNAFSLVSLTDRVNRIPFVPQKISNLKIFKEEGVATTSISVAERNGTLNLIPSTPRGGVGVENIHQKDKLRNFRIPHLELNDTVMADEIQNVRDFNGGSQLVAVQDVIDRRLEEMTGKHDATLEYGRVGAIRGVILDSDGSTVIYNLFTEFGFTQTQIDFLLGTTTTAILDKCMQVNAAIETALGAATYDHVQAIVGKTFWSRFINHPAVVTAYQFFQENGQKLNPLREDLRYAGFEFGGITWDVYRGNVGGIGFVPDSEANFFPIGVPGIFKTYFGPADYVQTVNTIGLPRYAMTVPDASGADKGRRILTQSNPLSLCLRPDVLIKGTTSN